MGLFGRNMKPDIKKTHCINMATGEKGKSDAN